LLSGASKLLRGASKGVVVWEVARLAHGTPPALELKILLGRQRHSTRGSPFPFQSLWLVAESLKEIFSCAFSWQSLLALNLPIRGIRLIRGFFSPSAMASKTYLDFLRFLLFISLVLDRWVGPFRVFVAIPDLPQAGPSQKFSETLQFSRQTPTRSAS
jgi:hypothetical protein